MIFTVFLPKESFVYFIYFVLLQFRKEFIVFNFSHSILVKRDEENIL